MTTIELKAEVHKMIDHSSDSALQEAFKLLKEFEERDDDLKFENNLKIILAEDKELLNRLAQ